MSGENDNPKLSSDEPSEWGADDVIQCQLVKNLAAMHDVDVHYLQSVIETIKQQSPEPEVTARIAVHIICGGHEVRSVKASILAETLGIPLTTVANSLQFLRGIGVKWEGSED